MRCVYFTCMLSRLADIQSHMREDAGQPILCGATGCNVCSVACVLPACQQRCCGHGRLHLSGDVLSRLSIRAPCSESLQRTLFPQPWLLHTQSQAKR